jgi:hypothetical protein
MFLAQRGGYTNTEGRSGDNNYPEPAAPLRPVPREAVHGYEDGPHRRVPRPAFGDEESEEPIPVRALVSS